MKAGKSKVKVLVDSVSGQTSLPAWLVSLLAVSSHGLPSSGAENEKSPSFLFPTLFVMPPVLLDSGHALMTSLNFNYLCKGLISKSYQGGGWGFHISMLEGHS